MHASRMKVKVVNNIGYIDKVYFFDTKREYLF